MNRSLHDFIATWLGAVAMTLLPVIFIAFVTMPMNLGHHPGERNVEVSDPARALHTT